jgi:transposase-like protein
MGKRKFTGEFKAQLVLEVLHGERELGAIAAQHQINPNQLRAWKAAFLEKAPTLFEENKAAKETARREAEAAAEKAEMLKTIGQLTLERDFLMVQAHERNKAVRLRRS